MTKILMGVGDEGHVTAVGSMLAALRFDPLELEGAYVLERFGEGGWDDPKKIYGSAEARYIAWQDEEAQRTLDIAKAECAALGLAMQPKLLKGFVGNCLLEYADAAKADLVALGSSGKGRLESILVGSVTRKMLVHSNKSLLIAKQPPTHKDGLTVVLATDHSDYAARCCARLVKLRPRGIRKIVVTTAYSHRLAAGLEAVTPNFKGDVDTWVRDELGRSNAKVIESLQPLDATFTSLVEAGEVNTVLVDVMQKEGADLLIMGAQGRGFVDRMMVGSVSLHQAFSEKHSVLVMRDS